MFLNVLLILSVVNITMCMTTKHLDGYPAGYLSDCPGSTKEAIITHKSLKYLTFSLRTPVSTTRKIYNYFQMKKLAKDPDLDLRRKTMLFVSGYMDSPSFPVAAIISWKYLEMGYNVLLLDTNYFTTMVYPRAARLVSTVGKHTAKMLMDLTKEGLDPGRLEIVSLSLGGQTASYIAKNFRQLTNSNISRVTALDPAGPCFRNLGPDHRLDKEDADFVDVIYTNIDGFGMANPVGHVNFYVNGGEFQPGEILWSYCGILCSHLRSFSLWISALIYPNSFIGIKCDTVQDARDRNCYENIPQVTNVLGLNTIKSVHGIFYLTTTNTYPYYLGEKGLKKENDFFLDLTKASNDDNILKV